MTPRADIYQEITDKIIAAIEAGTPPWRKPWTGSTPGIGFPTRSTGEPYRGINVLILWLTAAERGYSAAHWFTYRQAQAAGGQVRKGEKSATVVKYGTIEKEGLGDETETIPYAKSYRVFNAEQIDGLPESYQTRHEAPRDLGTEADPELDAWFARTGIRIETTSEPRAYYAPGSDKIHMPPIETFLTAHGFYQTLSHECIHGTGHAKRLDRLKAAHTKADYAREELVAEIGAAMLCATLGIHMEIEQNAAYVAGWLKALQEDKREIFRAASAAQKGCDWLIEAATGEAAEAA